MSDFYLKPYDDEYNCSTKHNIGCIEEAEKMANDIYQRAMQNFINIFSEMILED